MLLLLAAPAFAQPDRFGDEGGPGGGGPALGGEGNVTSDLDGLLPSGPQEAVPPPPDPDDFFRPRGRATYRVSARKAPLFVNGREVGHLYETCLVSAEPLAWDTGELRVHEVLTGFVRDGLVAEHRVAGPEEGQSLIRGLPFELLLLRDSQRRVVGKIHDLAGVELLESVPNIPPREGGPYTNLTPVGATIPATAAAHQEVSDVFDMFRRVQSGGVEIRFVKASGREPRPRFEELPALAPEIGALARVDYESGLGREMEYYRRMAAGRPLYIFLVDDPDRRTAYEHVYLPVKARSDWSYRSFRIRLWSDESARVREPMPLIVFPVHRTREGEVASLTETLKHELGHVLQELAAPIQNKGYDETFGSHTQHVRTNDEAAFVEGFAEYTAYRFRDSSHEEGPPAAQELVSRNNGHSYRSLLAYYWFGVRGRSAIKNRVSREELDALEQKVFDRIHGGDQPPRLEEFRAFLTSELTGKGEPPLTEALVSRELARHEQSNRTAVANVADEEYTEAEAEALSQAFTDIVTSSPMFPGGSEETYQESLQRFDGLAQRSPQDLMTNEGMVALILLELDRELSGDGTDFYGKTLEAMKRDPYDGRSRPRQPLNFKELVSVLDRDPDLRGRIHPVITRVTEGALREEHFQLARTRAQDPLRRARPGSATGAADSGGTPGPVAVPPAGTMPGTGTLTEDAPGFEDLQEH